MVLPSAKAHWGQKRNISFFEFSGEGMGGDFDLFLLRGSSSIEEDFYVIQDWVLNVGKQTCEFVKSI